MKLLFLSMHYAPEPCDSRTSRLARLMAARGHRAQALTSFPNYPHGRVYDGYRQKLKERKTIDGVDVVRVPMFPDHSLSCKRRALSYLSFGASAALLGGLFTRRPDVLWIHHPPLTTALAGWLLATVKRVPYVLEIHDLWPETLVSTGMIREGRVTRAIRRVCDFLHRRAAAIVVTSPGMKRNLIAHGTDADKIRVFPQFADERAFAPAPRDLEFGKAHALEGRFNVVFAGNIGTAQALDVILDAAARLRTPLSPPEEREGPREGARLPVGKGVRAPEAPTEHSTQGVQQSPVGVGCPRADARASQRCLHHHPHPHPTTTSEGSHESLPIQFMILGDGVDRPRLENAAKERGLANVRFLGHRPAAEMPAFFAWADALLVHLKDDPLFAITIPSKTQAYLAAARPILCGVAGDAADVVASSGAGLTFPPEDADALADTVRRLAALCPEAREAMGAVGARAAAEHFGQESLADRYEALFEAILVQRRARSAFSFARQRRV